MTPPAPPPAFPHLPPAARRALTELVGLDPRLGAIEAAAGPLPWRTRAPGFPSLLQAIVAQQISSKAAAAIWGRLAAIPGALHPATLATLDDAALIAAGLSRPKVAHARALAQAFAQGLLETGHLATLDDAAAVAAITAVRGLGPWTAEVYLLFAFQRPDVFPAGDVAVAGAAAHLLGLPTRPGPAALRQLAEAWRPHRGLAARLLWHHWRFITGRASMDEIPG